MRERRLKERYSKSSRDKRKEEVNIQKNGNELQEIDNTKESDNEVKKRKKKRDGGKYEGDKRAVQMERKCRLKLRKKLIEEGKLT